jgi:hypothetical protein
MIQQRGHLAMYINLWEQKGPGFPSHGLTPLATAPGWNLGFGQWLRKFRTLFQVANITSHCMGINYMGITWALQTVATIIYIYNYITLYNIPRLFDLGKKKNIPVHRCIQDAECCWVHGERWADWRPESMYSHTKHLARGGGNAPCRFPQMGNPKMVGL